MRVALVLALVACSSKQPDAAQTRVPIVPDKVAMQLGEFGMGLAVDLKALDLDKITSDLPAEVACARVLLKSASMGVLTLAGDTWEGHVMGLDEAAARDCAGKVAPLLGYQFQRVDKGYTLGLPGNPLEIVWHGDETVITQAHHPQRAGVPPGAIMELLGRVPRDAKAWLVSSGFPQYKIKQVAAWLETTADVWTFTVWTESVEQGAARPWIAKVVDGFKTSIVKNGGRVDDKWFVIESTPTTAKLVATIPVADLVRH